MRSFSYFNSKDTAFYKALILGVVASVCIIAILMCITTIVFTSSSLPPFEVIEYISVAIIAISVYFGGYIAARINKSKGLIIGLLVGSIVLISVLITGFCTVDVNLTLITLLKVVITPLSSAVGGIKGVNIKEKIKIK